MSLTQGAGAFAGVHENGINDFASAFFISRPRYLRWGSPVFVPATSLSETRIPAIPPFGIEYLIELSRPKLDLHPDTLGFALPPGPNQFSIELEAKLTVACNRRRRDQGTDKEPLLDARSTSLKVCGRGHIERIGNVLALRVDDIEIKDIEPRTLGEALACVFLMIVQELLSPLLIPYESFFIQIGNLNPVGGIVIEDDTAKALANIV